MRERFQERTVKSNYERGRRRFFEDREERIEEVKKKRDREEARYEE